MFNYIRRSYEYCLTSHNGILMIVGVVGLFATILIITIGIMVFISFSLPTSAVSIRTGIILIAIHSIPLVLFYRETHRSI